VLRKSREEVAKMARAGEIVAAALDLMREIVVPGITTGEMDRRAESLIRDLGGVPSFKGYHGYPAAICASVNEEIVHGIPGERRLNEGDIVSVDVGAIWQGYQGDAAITLAVGEISPEVQWLLEVTEASLHAGIAAAQVGAHLSDISHAVEMVAREAGLEVVREYGGHGIGRQMHEAPNILNWGPPGRGIPLREGMTLALEPMLTLGGYETLVMPDDWTVITADKSWAAHFEHTIVLFEGGAQILTRPNSTVAVSS
jgi:methionyl aminopeptidase